MMISLDDVRVKLQSILDGTDSEITDNVPTDFQYEVKTAGFHLDKISDKQTNKNFIPVFINSLGGEYNPVPQIKEQRQNVSVTFYFPVRFKEDFFALNEYLANCFVGTSLTIGTRKVISNMSIAQFGEIQDIDLKQFQQWVSGNYQREIDVNEPFMSMSFTLFLLQSAVDFAYGNEATISLSITQGTTTYTDSNVAFPDSSIQSNTEPSGQQLLGASTPEVNGFPVHTSYSSGFTVYYKKTQMYRYLLQEWFAGNSQKLSASLTISIDNKTYSRTCYLQSVNLNIAKGKLITLTFSFVKKAS